MRYERQECGKWATNEEIATGLVTGLVAATWPKEVRALPQLPASEKFLETPQQKKNVETDRSVGGSTCSFAAVGNC